MSYQYEEFNDKNSDTVLEGIKRNLGFCQSDND